MNIAIIGYGKMGHRLEALAGDHNLKPVLILDNHNNRKGEGITRDSFDSVDAAIDFSHPEAFRCNFKKVLETGTPLIVGTTGWQAEIPEPEAWCRNYETPVLYGSNFSLGVQLFAKLVERAGELFGRNTQFDAALNEIHHTEKADAPSGTADTLADNFLKAAQSGREKTYGVPDRGRVKPDAFYVTSQRLGSVFGEHQLRINSLFDDIEITHRARSRDAFASGALRAVSWIVKQAPGYYLLEDVVEEI